MGGCQCLFTMLDILRVTFDRLVQNDMEESCLTTKTIRQQEAAKIPGGHSNTAVLLDLVTILVPTLNEVDNIDPLVERIIAATKDAEFSVEIVFVDGGSKDGTQQKVIA